jgi:hypothetical protein
VNETVNVHCGFYSDSGGFKISDEDRRYMRTCKVAVSTCAFGVGMICTNLLEWLILLSAGYFSLQYFETGTSE